MKKIKILILLLLVASSFILFGSTDSTKVFNLEIFQYASFTNSVNTNPSTPSLGPAYLEPRFLKPWYTTNGFDFEVAKLAGKKQNHIAGLKTSIFGKLFLFDSDCSRPYHATFTLEAYYEFLIKDSSIKLAINHSSNGLVTTESRSWNRIVLTAAYKPINKLKVELSTLFGFDIPDNMDIVQKVGRIYINTVFENKHNYFRTRVNTNFNLKSGSISFKYQRGFKDKYLRLNAMVHLGNNLVLIDYNHSQISLNAGVSFHFKN